MFQRKDGLILHNICIYWPHLDTTTNGNLELAVHFWNYKTDHMFWSNQNTVADPGGGQGGHGPPLCPR